MKKSEANNSSEYRVYFFRLKKEEDADLIDYLNNRPRNLTEYFRNLVRNDMEVKNDKKDPSELSLSIRELFIKINSLAEKQKVFDDDIQGIRSKITDLENKYDRIEKNDKMTKIRLIETLQSEKEK